MRILVISGYPAWDKVSKRLMPSHHLFGIHELIANYETQGEEVRGILDTDKIKEGGYVEFYIWKSGKKNIFRQIYELWRKRQDYDLYYDQLNRCSIFLGLLKKFKIFKTKLITIMHHPPYNIQLKFSDSDAYIFFNGDYLKMAEKVCSKKKSRFFVNEWQPDILWYESVRPQTIEKGEVIFIDNGKSKRDRKLLIEAAEDTKLYIDYAGVEDRKSVV